MADENYTLPEVPVYREAIRKILNEDPVNAEEVLNPLVQALLENVHFVKLLAQTKAESDALDEHVGDDTAHLTAAERSAWNGKAEGNHSHTAADVGAIPTGQKGVASGVATLGTDAKIPAAQLPAMNYIPTSQKASANGVATLGADAKVPKAQLPASEGKRVARFTVGTSTSGWTADQVDYLCDGTDDQVEINAAITALPSTGGEVVILDGVYNISAQIKINKGNTKLSGNYGSTILTRMYNNYPPTYYSYGLILITERNCCVQFLTVDGNSDAFTGTYNDGIEVSVDGWNSKVINNILLNSRKTGINVSGDAATLNGNICINNNIGISAYGHLTSIIGNICKGSGYGISLNNDCEAVVIGNICNENETGIDLSGPSSPVVVGNMCKDNSEAGIYMSFCNQSLVIGNVCIRGEGTQSDYTSAQNTIYVHGNNNLIVGNNIMGKNYTNSGTGNTFANNKYQ